MSEKKVDERPLAVRLREAAQVVTDRIAARNKKLKLLRDKDRRNAYVMYLTAVEAHQDSVAMTEFVEFLNQENRFLRHELERVTNNSAWLNEATSMIDEVKKDETKKDEAEKEVKKETEPTKTIRVAGQEVETATRMPTIEKRDGIDTGE